MQQYENGRQGWAPLFYTRLLSQSLHAKNHMQ